MSHDSTHRSPAPLTTPRKRQLGKDTTGLLTPPDSNHKRATIPHDREPSDSARSGAGSAKRRRVTEDASYQPDPPTKPFPTPRKIVLRVGPRGDGQTQTPPLTPCATRIQPSTAESTPIMEKPKKPKADEDNERTPWRRTDVVLPPHLANLLALHKSFDLALSLHIATHPPVLPPPPSSAATTTTTYGMEPLDVRLEALTNYVAMKPIVEKSCGKRFGLGELKRLMWLWEETAAPTAEANPFIDSRESTTTNPTACYTVTPTRTIDSATSRRVHTYGFGLSIRLTPMEAASYVNTLHNDGEACGGAGKAVGAVARWSAGSEARCRVVERRLWDWVERHSGEQVSLA